MSFTVNPSVSRYRDNAARFDLRTCNDTYAALYTVAIASSMDRHQSESSTGQKIEGRRGRREVKKGSRGAERLTRLNHKAFCEAQAAIRPQNRDRGYMTMRLVAFRNVLFPTGPPEIYCARE